MKIKTLTRQNNNHKFYFYFIKFQLLILVIIDLFELAYVKPQVTEYEDLCTTDLGVLSIACDTVNFFSINHHNIIYKLGINESVVSQIACIQLSCKLQ